MMLADHAQVADGKLFISGGGWSVCGPGPVACGVAVLFHIPWQHTNEKIAFTLKLIDAKLRGYSQTHADFYRDLFPYSQYQNFLARDKELSTFSSQSLRVGVSYDIVRGGWRFVDRGTVNVIVDHMLFEYEDFRDLRNNAVVPGTEPLYSFDANVVQIFVSFWF